MKSKKKISVLVAGATGYIGIELIKLLVKHPKVKIKYICAQKSVGKSINKFDSNLKSKKLPKISNFKKAKLNEIDIIFSALPNGEAHKISKKINSKIKLIDLSGDFRIENPNIYKKWYKISHTAKQLIKKSIYSLPELVEKDLKKFKIISCPGCYPTSIQIPLIPLLRKKLINNKNIIIDSKSGYSGAGKNLHKKFKYKNIYSSISAYGVGEHKHLAEIEQEFKKSAKEKINIHFTPHLSPMFRGILSTIYVDLKNKVTVKKIYNFLKNYYKKKYFIRIKTFNKAIGTGDIVNTNFCNISICKDRKKNKAIILCAIDNLIKGGSGQAIQNMNLIYNYKETLGFN